MIVGSCVPRLPLNPTICGGSLGLWTPVSQRSPPEELLLEEELDEELLDDDEELLDEELELDELLLEDEELDELLPPHAATSIKLPEECTVKASIFGRPALVVASSRMLFTPALKPESTGSATAFQVVQAPVAGKSIVAISTPLMSNLPGRLPEALA
jgi:hypothetical protein